MHDERNDPLSLPRKIIPLSMVDDCFLDFFQNLDQSNHWKSHNPHFKWTREELEEFEKEKDYREMERLAMAAWWEEEGVRCWTWGPPKNPYL